MISHSLAYQRRHKEDGLCVSCTEPATVGFKCAKHAWRIRLSNRRRSNTKLPYEQTMPEDLQIFKRYPVSDDIS